MLIREYLIDDIIFLLTIVVSAIFLNIKYKKLSWDTFLAIMLLVLVVNSSYNSHFTIVNDNNFSTLRTFIWSFKLVYKFSLADIFCAIILLLNIGRIKAYISRNHIYAVIFISDIAIYLISLLGLFLTGSYAVDNWAHFIIFSKSLLYSLAFLCIFERCLRKNINIIPLLLISLVLSFISMKSFDISLVKNRYGNAVVLSDQEDISTILYFTGLYYIIGIMMKSKNFFKKKLKINSKMVIATIAALFVFYEIIITLSKGMLLFLALDVVIVVLLFRYKKLLAAIIALGVVVLIINFDSIVGLLTSESMFTRLYQITDYTDYINDSGRFEWFFGTGIGGAYYSRGLGDTGEIKGIDILTYGTNWKFEMQIPILAVFKDSGLVGLTIFLVSRIYITVYILKKCKLFNNKKDPNKVYVITAGIYLIIMLFTQYIFHSSVGPISIFMLYMVKTFSKPSAIVVQKTANRKLLGEGLKTGRKTIQKEEELGYSYTYKRVEA